MKRAKSTVQTLTTTPSRKQFLAFGLGTIGAVFIAGCSDDGNNGGGSGGSSGGSPGAGGSAGSPGAAGSPGLGGSPGVGGSPGAAGSPGLGGSPGAAGSPGAGGSPGAAGSPGAGGSPGAAGRGGSTGAAGSSAGGAGGGGTATSCSASITAAISGNHGHALMIPLADVTAGAEKCYNAMGTAGHAHYVTLSAADFVTLRNGGNVTKYSCNGGDHQFVLSCKSGAPAAVAPPECDANSNVGATAC